MEHEQMVLDVDAAERGAKEGMEAAARRAGAEWQRQALRAVTIYAEGVPAFTMEEARAAIAAARAVPGCDPDLPGDPPDSRAWGAVARALRVNGIIRFKAVVRSKSRSHHRGHSTLWTSLVYRGDHRDY